MESTEVMDSPILKDMRCITPRKQITCFWGDLSAANKWTVRNYHVNTFKWRTYEIDSHLVQLEVPATVNGFSWNTFVDVMVHNQQEMIFGDPTITDVIDQKM
jgi:nicotinamide mononucleotide adenylyltransferase